MQSYGYNIWLVRDKIHWEKINGVDVQPPIYDKKVGRPAKNRKKNPIELEGGTKLTNTWSDNALQCLWATHNKRTCQKYADQINVPNPEEELEEYDNPSILEVYEVQSFFRTRFFCMVITMLMPLFFKTLCHLN